MLDALLLIPNPNPVIRIAPPVLVAIPNKHPPPASQPAVAERAATETGTTPRHGTARPLNAPAPARSPACL
jgi:hypothetical protein